MVGFILQSLSVEQFTSKRGNEDLRACRVYFVERVGICLFFLLGSHKVFVDQKPFVEAFEEESHGFGILDNICLILLTILHNA